MPAGMLRLAAIAAACFCGGIHAASSEQPRHGPASVQGSATHKTNRLPTPQASEPALNIPGQTTVLTREIMDDMKATSVRDALRSTAGVTVGR
jgi:outer membrane receptor for monomeric catechols